MMFSDVLHNTRITKGMSYAKLAELSGIPVSTIAHYETNNVMPPLDKADALLRALGVEMVIGRKERTNDDPRRDPERT